MGVNERGRLSEKGSSYRQSSSVHYFVNSHSEIANTFGIMLIYTYSNTSTNACSHKSVIIIYNRCLDVKTISTIKEQM